MKENGFTLKKAKSKQYPIESMTDDQALLTNTPGQAKLLLHKPDRNSKRH